MNEIEMAIDALIVIDQQMTNCEQKIREIHVEISEGDAWDKIDAEDRIVQCHLALGTASVKVVMEMNAVIYHGQKLIDAWKDTELMMIGRAYSQDAPFYKRCDQEWPEVAKQPAWQMLRSGGVPF